MILTYVHAHKKRSGVEPICRVLSQHNMMIAPGTYHKWLAVPVRENQLIEAHLVDDLRDIYIHHRRVFGIWKMWHQARRQHLVLGRDQVARLMAVAGISGAVRGKHRTVTTVAAPAAARHPDRVKRSWSAPRVPEQLWVADFTYVWTAAGFVYVSFITDVCSRRVLGWKCSSDKKVHLVTGALAQALSTRRRANAQFTATGLVHHSDRGVQSGLNWSSQHFDHGGVWWHVVSSGRIGLFGRRCVRRVARCRLGTWSARSGA